MIPMYTINYRALQLKYALNSQRIYDEPCWCSFTFGRLLHPWTSSDRRIQSLSMWRRRRGCHNTMVSVKDCRGDPQISKSGVLLRGFPKPPWASIPRHGQSSLEWVVTLMTLETSKSLRLVPAALGKSGWARLSHPHVLTFDVWIWG